MEKFFINLNSIIFLNSLSYPIYCSLDYAFATWIMSSFSHAYFPYEKHFWECLFLSRARSKLFPFLLSLKSFNSGCLVNKYVSYFHKALPSLIVPGLKYLSFSETLYIYLLGLFKEISMLMDKPLLIHKCHYCFLHSELERKWTDVINGFSVHLKCCSYLKVC